MKRPGTWLDVFGRGVFGILATFWLLVLLRIALVPGNHIGGNILWAMVLGGIGLGAGGVCWLQGRRLLGLSLLVLGAFSIVGVFVLDRFNILVYYETWLKRGMPERPF